MEGGHMGQQTDDQSQLKLAKAIADFGKSE